MLSILICNSFILKIYSFSHRLNGENYPFILNIIIRLLKALRLGMSPGALRIGSRFLGLPGLALTAGMWGYDKWKNRSVNDED